MDATDVTEAGCERSIHEPLLPDVVRAIRTQAPGSVRYVARKIVDAWRPGLHLLTEIDIETDTAVVQVKAGATRGLARQIDQSRRVTGKPIIALAPRMTDVSLAWYRAKGYTVFRDLDDLLDFLRAQG
jgi:hypothetical protein